jgi:hypothetical protein
MAIVAKMSVTKVTASGSGHLVPCEETDEGAIATETAPGAVSWYGVMKWLGDAKFVRLAPGTSQETWELQAVSTKGEADDPNREWAAATPAGQLTLTVNNPECFGYVEPGREYRITIERIRGPRDAKQ